MSARNPQHVSPQARHRITLPQLILHKRLLVELLHSQDLKALPRQINQAAIQLATYSIPGNVRLASHRIRPMLPIEISVRLLIVILSQIDMLVALRPLQHILVLLKPNLLIDE